MILNIFSAATSKLDKQLTSIDSERVLLYSGSEWVRKRERSVGGGIGGKMGVSEEYVGWMLHWSRQSL